MCISSSHSRIVSYYFLNINVPASSFVFFLEKSNIPSQKPSTVPEGPRGYSDHGESGAPTTRKTEVVYKVPGHTTSSREVTWTVIYSHAAAPLLPLHHPPSLPPSPLPSMEITQGRFHSSGGHVPLKFLNVRSYHHYLF